MANNNEKKKFWLSKTFWLNILVIIAMIIQYFTGFVIDPGQQVIILGVINVILRAITKQPIDWETSKVTLRKK